MLMHPCVAEYVSNRLFWVDAKLHVIFTSDFNGQNRQVVLTSYNNLVHPFSVAVFEVSRALCLTKFCLTDMFVVGITSQRAMMPEAGKVRHHWPCVTAVLVFIYVFSHLRD